MRSIKNPDRQSAGLARGIVDGIHYREVAKGMAGRVVLRICDHDGDHHELEFEPELFADVGGAAKLVECMGAEVVCALVHTDVFDAPGGPVKFCHEVVVFLSGLYAGRVLDLLYTKHVGNRVYLKGGCKNRVSSGDGLALAAEPGA